MLDEFAPYGIEMVAISPDTEREAKLMKGYSSLAMPLLSDADLDVIDLYGVRHEDAWGAPRDGSFKRALAIPTTILIDADGVIRWIDQTDDYRVRSNEERVLAAVREFVPAAFAESAA